ncbi:OmpP1/FadL family transporter [Uliginosibacterium gangwonense]|uniref:OmpP1/FadL family transporter n=1 Tax=Uliginosibacterium gangwonense TaxID=392736 RepID=UPI0003758DAB|nr:outer membrane protein transport protein [Uliginosibacterium gangwonense]
MKKTVVAQSVALVAGLFSMGHAGASGFQLLEQDASGLGNAYAGSAAVAEDAGTIYYNPAGMTRLKDMEISLGVAAIRPSYKYNNGNSTSGVLNGDGGDAGGVSALPNAYGSYAVSKNVYLGVGVGAPFGLRTEYDNPWVGAAQSLKFDIKTKNVNPSLAWRVNDKLSVGGGINVQKIDIDYSRAVSVAAPSLAASTARFKADDTATGWNLGAIYQASQSMRLGVSYRSAIKYKVKGNLSVTGPVAALNAAGTSEAEAQVKLPSTFILSVVQQLDERWEMLGDISHTSWSDIHEVDIIRSSGAAAGQVAQVLDTDFRDTWRVALGGTYRVNDAWRARFGIAYDQSPVKGASTRLVSLPDNDRVWLSTGAQWAFAKDSRLDLGLTYLYIHKTQVHNDQTSSTATANRGLVDGYFKGSVWVLAMQYSQAF